MFHQLFLGHVSLINSHVTDIRSFTWNVFRDPLNSKKGFFGYCLTVCHCIKSWIINWNVRETQRLNQNNAGKIRIYIRYMVFIFTNFSSLMYIFLLRSIVDRFDYALLFFLANSFPQNTQRVHVSGHLSCI